jgi:hypothetical protein
MAGDKIIRKQTDAAQLEKTTWRLQYPAGPVRIICADQFSL